MFYLKVSRMVIVSVPTGDSEEPWKNRSVWVDGALGSSNLLYQRESPPEGFTRHEDAQKAAVLWAQAGWGIEIIPADQCTTAGVEV
jgi:hypothetical protein